MTSTGTTSTSWGSYDHLSSDTWSRDQRFDLLRVFRMELRETGFGGVHSIFSRLHCFSIFNLVIAFFFAFLFFRLLFVSSWEMYRDQASRRSKGPAFCMICPGFFPLLFLPFLLICTMWAGLFFSPRGSRVQIRYHSVQEFFEPVHSRWLVGLGGHGNREQGPKIVQ